MQAPCCCCSVAKSCLTLCDLMHCSTPGLPVLHYLLEYTQTRVHWVSDAIQPSYPLWHPSPPAFNLSQHQFFPMSRLFLSGGQSILASASASVLPMSIQGWLPWVISTWWASCDSDFRHIQVRRGSPNYPPKACLFWFLKGKNPSSCDPLPPSVSSKAVPSPLFTL